MPTFVSLTLEPATAISRAVSGAFSGGKVQEIVAAQGTALSLYRVDSSTGVLELVCRDEVFGLVREIVAFRLAGAQRDYLAVTSDCGRLVILQWAAGKWAKVHQETYGKTGVRRIVPGQYLTADPKGRSVVIGAVERQKLLYILNRDNQNNLQISSPLECHKSNLTTFSLISLDVGYDNPVFVALEANNLVPTDAPEQTYEPPPKFMSYYEMDLGLNHIVKKCSIPVHQSAHTLIPVSAGNDFEDGPGGVLVCCSDYVAYHKPDHPVIRCRFPKRLGHFDALAGDAATSLYVVAWSTHKMKDFYFILVQSDLGDLYRIELINEKARLNEIRIRYFDSIPVASSLCILRTGFLFAASEVGDHVLYQFLGVGNEDDYDIVLSSNIEFDEAILPFRPRELKNLLPVYTHSSRTPLTDMRAVDCIGVPAAQLPQSIGLSHSSPQLYAFRGCSTQSKLSIMRLGVGMEEIAASEVPGRPCNVFTLRESYDAEYHSILLLSFTSGSTLVMRVTDTIEEIADTQLITNKATFHASTLMDNTIIQVTEIGATFLKVSPESDRRVMEQWKSPPGKRVVAACSNGSQLLLALSGGVIVYFAIDLESGSYNLREIDQKDTGIEITALCLVPTRGDPRLPRKGDFCVISGVDRLIRVLSLQSSSKSMWQTLAQYQVPNDSQAESLLISASAGCEELNLDIGLSTGVVVRTEIGLYSGVIEGYKRRRFIGSLPVKLVDLELDANTRGIAVLSSRPWIEFNGKLQPIVSQQIDAMASLNTEHCAWGFVAVTDTVMKITALNIEASRHSMFSTTDIPLDFTPRKSTVFPPPPSIQETLLNNSPIIPPSPNRPWLMAVIESDHNAFDLVTQQQISQALNQVQLEHQQPNPERLKADDEEEEQQEPVDIATFPGLAPEFNPPLQQVGSLKAGDNKWGGCLKLISPTAGVVMRLPFGPDEAPISICVCQFMEYPDYPALVVGTVTGLNLKTRKCLRGGLKTYVYDASGQLKLFHETPLEEGPQAMCSWQGRLLVSVGNRLRIYTFGKKRLLKKCEFKNLPLGVNWIAALENRFYVADIREGFHVIQYDPIENSMRIIADMIVPRWVVTGELLDPFTIAGVDKLDNFFVARLPLAVVKKTAVSVLSASLTGAANVVDDKLERICEYHLGDTMTSLRKTQLTIGGIEVLLYSTILGAIGAMVPLSTQSEIDTLSHLELLMRNEDVSLVGREHLFFRSAVFPVKNVIDGDLLRHYAKLTPERQAWIAQQMNLAPPEVHRIVDELIGKVI